MKEDSDGIIIKFIFGVTIGIILLFFAVNIIEDIIKWYKLPIYLTTKQWIGINFLIYIITVKAIKYKEDYTLLEKAIAYTIYYLLIWGTAYFIHILY